VEEYQEWRQEVEQRQRELVLSKISRPGTFRILPDHVFRSSNPAVVGVEILEGALSPGSKFMDENGDVLGTIKAIQEAGESIDLARKGDEVALSLTNVQIGRQVEKGGTYYAKIGRKDYKIIQRMEEHISQDELNALEKIVEIQDKKNPRWKIG
jgi:translation initiation factor 5B